MNCLTNALKRLAAIADSLQIMCKYSSPKLTMSCKISCIFANSSLTLFLTHFFSFYFVIII